MTKKHHGSSKRSAKERNARFVQAYIANGENATEAYMVIKPTVARSTAGTEGHKLLKLPAIHAAIEAERAKLRAKFALTTDRVVQEQARIVYFNPKKLMDANGKAIPLHQLDDDTAAALSVVEFEETSTSGKGKEKVVVHRKMKHRPYNKVSALNMVNKILRVYDKPPPPPPPPPGSEPLSADPKDTARRMAFLLARGAAAENREANPHPKPVKKKATISA